MNEGVHTVRVLRPDLTGSSPRPVAAPVNSDSLPRLARDSAIELLLIENGKARAGAFLQTVAEKLRAHAVIANVTMLSHSASETITPDQARQMAARSHLVITGVGD